MCKKEKLNELFDSLRKMMGEPEPKKANWQTPIPDQFCPICKETAINKYLVKGGFSASTAYGNGIDEILWKCKNCGSLWGGDHAEVYKPALPGGLTHSGGSYGRPWRGFDPTRAFKQNFSKAPEPIGHNDSMSSNETLYLAGVIGEELYLENDVVVKPAYKQCLYLSGLICEEAYYEAEQGQQNAQQNQQAPQMGGQAQQQMGGQPQQQAQQSKSAPQQEQTPEQQLLVYLESNKAQIKHYKKFAKVRARQSQGGEQVQTKIDGRNETDVRTTNPGDWVVSNLESQGEEQIVDDVTFKKRYDVANPKGDVYSPKGANFYGLAYSGEPISFSPPNWGGSKQNILKGYMVGGPDPNQFSKDFYGIDPEAFAKTYKPANQVVD